MAEDREEELGEGRHQARSNGAYKERIKGAPSALRGGGAGLELLRPVDALRRRHPAQPGKARLRHVQRVQGRRVPSSGRGLTRRHGFLGHVVGLDLEILEAKKEGEAQERGSEQQPEKAKKQSLGIRRSLINLRSC